MLIKNFIKRCMLIFSFFSVLSLFGILTYVVIRAQDPEIFLKNLLLDESKEINQAFFSPDDNVQEILTSLISCEKKSISFAIYSMTQRDILNALLQAHTRGVKITGVADGAFYADRFSKVPDLIKNGIPVYVYKPRYNNSLMHNKFCIFEQNIENKSIVWTGSYNFTNKASTSNQENIVILDNTNIVNKFKKQFEILKTRAFQAKDY